MNDKKMKYDSLHHKLFSMKSQKILIYYVLIDVTGVAKYIKRIYSILSKFFFRRISSFVSSTIRAHLPHITID